MACSFNLEYLLVGGKDVRRPERPVFSWYDWMVGGWGARAHSDGASAASPLFGAQFASQPIEGQERLNPVVTTHMAIVTDSGGPGQYRGGCGVEKGVRLTDSDATVMSYCCDRERSVPWGLAGGLASTPQGLWLNPATSQQQYLGAVFSNIELVAGDVFRRSSSGGGGYGDPLLREIAAVREDVLDGYVSIERAAKDYGVVLVHEPSAPGDLQVDEPATAHLRAHIREHRLAWLAEDPELVARRFRAGELDVLDCIRQYGVILDWGTGQLLPRTTAQHRDLTLRRAASWWQQPTG